MALNDLLSLPALEALASRRALEAGRDYYEQGRVLRLDASSDRVRARVEGAADAPYSVRYRLAASGQLAWECDCPAAQDGAFCKHLVATALAWRDRQAQQVAEQVAPLVRRAAAPASASEGTDSDLFSVIERPSTASVEHVAPVAIPPSVLPTVPSEVQWLPAGQSVTIHGIPIEGGLVYTGRRPAGLRHVVPRSLLDPRYRVAWAGDAHHWMGSAHPDYITLSDTGRRAYLNWLSTGRQDPWAHVSYVQLFFSGLEHRVILAAHSDEFEQDRDAIREELGRLLLLYGARMPHPLRRAVASLRDWLRFSDTRLGLSSRAQLVEKPGQCGEQAVQLALAFATANRVALSAELAFECAMQWASNSARGYALQYPAFLTKLFTKLFAEQFPEGLRGQATGTALQLRYQPLCEELLPFVRPAQDVQQLQAATLAERDRKVLNKLLRHCVQQLEPYSKYCVRNPGGQRLEAHMLLPVAAMPEPVGRHVSSLAGPDGRRVQDLQSILRGFALEPSDATDQLFTSHPPARIVSLLAQQLVSWGLDMEPSAERLGRNAKGAAKVCIYEAGVHTDMPDAALYDMLCAALRLVLSVAQPTVETFSATRHFLAQWLDDAERPAFSDALKRRMLARAELELEGPWRLAGVRNALGDVPEGLEGWLKRGLLVALHLHPAEHAVRFKALEKAYKLLNWEPQQLFSDLHLHATDARAGSSSERPRRALPKGNRPLQPAMHGVGLAPEHFGLLDLERLDELTKETQQTAQLLAGIFTDDSEDVTGESSARASGSAGLVTDGAESLASPSVHSSAAPAAPALRWGLDAAHSALVADIATQQQWSRQQMNAMAKQHGRMLDAALERINDAAIDATGEPLCEGDDPIVVNLDLLDFRE